MKSIREVVSTTSCCSVKGEGHLHIVVREYVAHYHVERNHQRIRNELIEPEVLVGKASGKVRRRRRLGGLLSYYEREAA